MTFNVLAILYGLNAIDNIYQVIKCGKLKIQSSLFLFLCQMKTIRDIHMLKRLIWLLFLLSHIYISFTCITFPVKDRNEHKIAGHTYFVAASDVSFWAERNRTEKTFSLQVLICLLFVGSIFSIPKIIPAYRQLRSIYSQCVRIFNLSPCYLINRVLLI